MTLILTALCKNGVCVCADKRSRTWNSSGNKKHQDDLNKIYLFNNAPIIIFNHGVNKFNNKYWNTLCSEYENTDRWRGKSLRLISIDFKSYIENDVLRQLHQNIQNIPNLNSVSKASFALCGKDLLSNRFEFYELHWAPEFSSNFWCDTRLIISGEGYKKYLESYLTKNKQSNTVECWGAMNTIQAKEELKRLFSIAVDNRKQSGGDEFSDSFDIECVSGTI